MLHLIIDGYNLIRQVPKLARLETRSLQTGRDVLIEKLKRYRRQKPHKITIVFDGASRMSEFAMTHKEGGIHVCFSPDTLSADDVIKDLAREAKARGIVVSSDRSVLQYALGCGCAVISSTEFYDKLLMAEAWDKAGLTGEDQKGEVKKHKRWTTYKKGPSKKLPKSERRNRIKTDKL